jgi:hypothetical protein
MRQIGAADRIWKDPPQALIAGGRPRLSFSILDAIFCAPPG